jgi:hypothetical protein
VLPCGVAVTPVGVVTLAATVPVNALAEVTATLMVLLNPLNIVSDVADEACALKAVTTDTVKLIGRL